MTKTKTRRQRALSGYDLFTKNNMENKTTKDIYLLFNNNLSNRNLGVTKDPYADNNTDYKNCLTSTVTKATNRRNSEENSDYETEYNVSTKIGKNLIDNYQSVPCMNDYQLSEDLSTPISAKFLDFEDYPMKHLGVIDRTSNISD